MPQAPKRRRLPVVFLELDVVLREIDADRFQASQILLQDIIGAWFQNDLQLLVLVKPVRIFAISAVRGTAARLHVSHSVRLRSQHAKKRFGSHRAGAHFQVVRLLDDGAAIRPIALQFENCVLKGVHY